MDELSQASHVRQAIKDDSLVLYRQSIVSTANPNPALEVHDVHVFVDDPEIDKTASFIPTPNEDALRGSLQGSYDASVDIVSAQLTYIFD